MPSRDINLLDPSLRFAWLHLKAKWLELNPDEPQPFITCTFRSNHEQQDAYDRGASKAKPGQSLHNYVPAYAFDVAFDHEPQDGVGNDVTWVWEIYEQLKGRSHETFNAATF